MSARVARLLRPMGCGQTLFSRLGVGSWTVQWWYEMKEPS